MKLSYFDLPGSGAGPPAILLHREGATAPADAVAFAGRPSPFGRTVVPSGLYGYYPSGMSIGGTSWYRILPGFEGTDPISLTTAVVQVCDLLDDLALDDAVLAGWGQGAVVALVAAAQRPGVVQRVVSVDAALAHLKLVPRGAWSPGSGCPVLLVASSQDALNELDPTATLLGERKFVTTTWWWAEAGSRDEFDQALAECIGRWMEHGKP